MDADGGSVGNHSVIYFVENDDVVLYLWLCASFWVYKCVCFLVYGSERVWEAHLFRFLYLWNYQLATSNQFGVCRLKFNWMKVCFCLLRLCTYLTMYSELYTAFNYRSIILTHFFLTRVLWVHGKLEHSISCMNKGAEKSKCGTYNVQCHLLSKYGFWYRRNSTCLMLDLKTSMVMHSVASRSYLFF